MTSLVNPAIPRPPTRGGALYLPTSRDFPSSHHPAQPERISEQGQLHRIPSCLPSTSILDRLPAIEEGFWINTDHIASMICDVEAIGTLGEAAKGPAAPMAAKKAAPRFSTERGKALAPPFRFCGNGGTKVGS